MCEILNERFSDAVRFHRRIDALTSEVKVGDGNGSHHLIILRLVCTLEPKQILTDCACHIQLRQGATQTPSRIRRRMG